MDLSMDWLFGNPAGSMHVITVAVTGLIIVTLAFMLTRNSGKG